MWYVDYNVKPGQDGEDCIPCPEWEDLLNQLKNNAAPCRIYWKDDKPRDFLRELKEFQDTWFDEPYFTDAPTLSLVADRERFSKAIDLLTNMMSSLMYDLLAIDEELEKRT